MLIHLKSHVRQMLMEEPDAAKAARKEPQNLACDNHQSNHQLNHN